MLKRLLCCLFLVFAASVTFCHAQSQTPTTQGTEFWLSFMRNGYRDGNSDHLTLIASAKEGCEVTVTNPSTGYTNTFTVPDQGVQTLEIPTAHGYNEQKAGNAYKGLLVTSTDTISLYIANEAENSYDAANVLPINALGSQYMIQSNKSIYEQSGHNLENRASFLIIAIEDDTRVQIIPVCETWDDHRAGDPYIVTLNTGECYHVLNKNMGNENNIDGDFSGTWVESLDEKPIAVFNGNCITSIPGGNSSGFDHVFEQAMPVDNWGMRFVVTSTEAPPMFNLLNDVVKVTALNDNTTVMRDDELLCQLNAGESFSFDMDLVNEKCTFLKSDNPIAVYLYNHSHRNTTTAYGDPSMVWISPVEQTVYEVTFSTFQAQKVERHYVNIVCYTDHVAELRYDNSSVSEQFHPVPHATEFSYARFEVTRGAHNIRCPGGFVAHVYGMGQNEGYAYTVGSSAKILTKQLYVDEILSTELPDGYSVCESDATIQFRASFNYEFDHISWDFGDGTVMDDDEEVTYTYTRAGDFDMNAVVFRQINGAVQAFDTLQVAIHVTPLVQIPVNYSTCASTYHFHGQDFPVPYFDDFIVQSDEGCDTIYHMNLESSPSVSAPVRYDTICEGDEGIMWFDTLRSKPGTYLVIAQTPAGCDSVCLLHLEVATRDTLERWVQSCAPYRWNGVTYETSGNYYQTFTTSAGCEYDSVLHFTLIPAGDLPPVYKDTCDQYNWLGQPLYESDVYDTIIVGADGCESHLTLYLTLHDSPSFERIIGHTQVAVATNYWHGEYHYYLDDSSHVDASRISWELLDNPPGAGQWEFFPHGASCTLIAYSRGERELRVTTGDGMCDKTRSLIINGSNYDVGEAEAINLEVYPNPARDAVTVKGCEMEEVTVYNLLGQKLLTVPAHGAAEVNVKVDDLPQALYLFEARTTRGNKTTLVSVIK